MQRRGAPVDLDTLQLRAQIQAMYARPQQVTMSSCCSRVGAAAERQFSQQRATKDLANYRIKGPGSTARLLLAGIAKAGPPRGRLLDIGSGVGALTFELLDRGLTEAIGVDMSSAYVAAATAEATRRGRTDSVRFVHGDFVGIANQFVAADVVTLDRVVCCYGEYEPLLEESARHAARCFALSYPRDVWYVRAWVRLQNVARALCRNPFRTFVHSASAVEDVIRRAGFELVGRSYTRTWCADVYRHA
jgi:magnesium-protoporphyrin O-methyltransferase